MSENLSNELPVITSIDELPETAIEELTEGNEPEVVAEKSATKAAAPKKVNEAPVADTAEDPTQDKIESVEVTEVKPKRKRRTKAEMEAARAAEKAAKGE